MELARPPCYWLMLPSEVLAVVLAQLPAVALARLQCTCVVLRGAAGAIVQCRLTALRPPETDYCAGTAAPTQALHGLEGCRGCVLALGGFDTSRLTPGTPDDDQHDAEGCLADVELLRFQRPGELTPPVPSIAAMEARRADLATVSLSGGWVFAVGGRCGAAVHSSVARLDLGTGRWTDVESMVVPLSGCAAAPLGSSRFLVVGGAFRQSWRATSLVQVYDARGGDGDSWSIAREMSQFRCFSAAVSVSHSVPHAGTASASAVVAVLGGVSRSGTQMGSNQQPNV